MISRQPPIYMVSFAAIGNAKWERNCEAERPDEPGPPDSRGRLSPHELCARPGFIGAEADCIGRLGNSRASHSKHPAQMMLIVVASLLNLPESEVHHPRIAVSFSGRNRFAVNSFWGDCLLARSANGLGLGCAKVYVS